MLLHGLLWVLQLGVVQVLGCLDQLHGQDQVIVLLVVDYHLAWTLGVVDERALDKGNLNGGLSDVVFAELGEVEIVGVSLDLCEAAAGHARG